MNKHTVFTANVVLELTNGFKEWLTFNIADGTADFDNGNFSFSVLIIAVKATFDSVCDMGNDLNCIAAKIPASFCRQNIPVDFTTGHIAVFV